jgi:hypothetical protein
MKTITISQATARRYVLGRQGLWPSRRWAGKDGTEEALRTIEAVQMDPLNVVARDHDIILWSRVMTTILRICTPYSTTTAEPQKGNAELRSDSSHRRITRWNFGN